MKKNKKLKFLLSCILSVVLVAAIVLTLAGCKNNTQAQSEESSSPTPPTENISHEYTEVGKGKNSFTFIVKDGDGKETYFTVKTDEAVVGKALLKEKLIDGDNEQYGLYVKYVNGIRADYEKDGAYWAFYINGEFAVSGVDSTEIKDGEIYSFVYTKS